MNSPFTRPGSTQRGNIKFVPLVLIVALSAAGAGVWFGTKNIDSDTGARRDTSEPLTELQTQLKNTLVLPEDFKTVPAFNLLDKNGASAGTELLKGKWSMLFFGFTHCPDICPMTLSVADRAIDKIKSENSSLPAPQVVFVSVDPKRDTPKILKNYVEHFNPAFNALTGELNATFELTQPLGIVVSYTADKDQSENYTVDHSAAILLIDPELRLRGKFNAPHEVDTIAADYQTLLENLL